MTTTTTATALQTFVCPACRFPLEPQPGGMSCGHCGRAYEERDGILDLLPQGTGELTLAQRSAHWRLSASVYEAWRGAAFTLLSGRHFPVEREREVLLHWLSPLQPGIYLDAASATGHQGIAVARELYRRGIPGRVVLLDLSRPMLAKAKAKAAGVPNVLFVRADVENLPFADGSLAGAVDGGSLNEYRHARWAVAELARVLAPGAPLVCSSQVAVSGPAGGLQRLARVSGLTFPTEVETLTWLAEADLEVRRRWRRGGLLLTRSTKRAAR